MISSRQMPPRIMRISAVTPANGAETVAADINPTITFRFAGGIINTDTIATGITMMAGEDELTFTTSETDHVLTIIPDEELPGETEITITVARSLKSVIGKHVLKAYSWSFTTEETDLVVSSVSPLDDATNVAVGAEIVVTFDKNINYETLSGEISVMAGEEVISFTTYTEDNVVTITPDSDLPPFTEISVTLGTGIQSENGNTLVEPYVWTFTTIQTYITVTAVTPLNEATGVNPAVEPTVTFSESIDTDTLVGRIAVTADSVAVDITYDYTLGVLTITPDVPFNHEAVIEVTLSAGIATSEGAILAADYVWSFTAISALVVESVTPLDAATDIDKAVEPVVVFNRDVNLASLSGKIDVEASSDGVTYASVGFTYGVVDDTLTISPTSAFDAHAYIRITLSAGITGEGGCSLEDDYIWDFRIESNFYMFMTWDSPQPTEDVDYLDEDLTITHSIQDKWVLWWGCENDTSTPIIRAIGDYNPIGLGLYPVDTSPTLNNSLQKVGDGCVSFNNQSYNFISTNLTHDLRTLSGQTYYRPTANHASAQQLSLSFIQWENGAIVCVYVKDGKLVISDSVTEKTHTATIPLNAWSCLGWSYDIMNDLYSLYVDGSAQHFTFTAWRKPASNVITVFRLGCAQANCTFYIDQYMLKKGFDNLYFNRDFEDFVADKVSTEANHRIVGTGCLELGAGDYTEITGSATILDEAIKNFGTYFFPTDTNDETFKVLELFDDEDTSLLTVEYDASDGSLTVGGEAATGTFAVNQYHWMELVEDTGNYVLKMNGVEVTLADDVAVPTGCTKIVLGVSTSETPTDRIYLDNTMMAK